MQAKLSDVNVAKIMNITDPVIGHRHFVDGVCRPVYLGQGDLQYVIDDDGNRVTGHWIFVEDLADPPIIVDIQDNHRSAFVKCV